MTGNELARRTGSYGAASLPERQQYAMALAAASDLLPASYWDNPRPDGNGGMTQRRVNPGKVLFMTETAAMLGIHPMAGLTNVHIIEGKPTLSAALWGALIREAGHKLRVWTEGQGDDLVAHAHLIRADDPDFTFKATFSMRDARAAGLAGKGNWAKYPASMCKARVTTQIARDGAPEVAMGAAYTPEELNPNLVVNEAGDPVELLHVPEAKDAPAASPAEPRQAPRQAPVMTEPTPEPTAAENAAESATQEEGVDWSKLIADAMTADELRALYRQAAQAGMLDQEIKQGRKKRKLSEVITDAGTALAKAETERVAAEAQQAEEAFAEAAHEAQDGEGHDPDVVVATIDGDDDKPMAMGD